MDEDGDGELDFQEFQEGLKTIDNKLLPNEIQSIYDHCIGMKMMN